jgi:hypothetical protein
MYKSYCCLVIRKIIPGIFLDIHIIIKNMYNIVHAVVGEGLEEITVGLQNSRFPFFFLFISFRLFDYYALLIAIPV